MNALAMVAPASEMPDPAREALRQALQRVAECQVAVEKHRAAVGRARAYVEEGEQAIVEAEAAVEAARESHAARLAAAAGDDTGKPASGVRAARQTLENARDDHEAAADALSRLEADNSAEVDLEVAEIDLRIARLEVLRPIAEDLIGRLASARSMISNAKHVLRILLEEDRYSTTNSIRSLSARNDLAAATKDLYRQFEDAQAAMVEIDDARVAAFARWRKALLVDWAAIPPAHVAHDFAEIAPAAGEQVRVDDKPTHPMPPPAE